MRKPLPDAALYQPLFSPWLAGDGEFATLLAELTPFTVVSPDRVWMLYTLARQARHLPGDFWECGVYKGGTATMLARLLSGAPDKRLRLFDTFDGMPATDPERDYHRKGDFADTSLEGVRQRVGDAPNVAYYPGFIPDTFQGLEGERVAFAHVDVDIYRSVRDCCDFLYPRLVGGGVLVFDDYGFPSCPGARAAVDGFFADKPECPLVLPTGQAVVTKLP
jgi:O-methyltransferase